jgi:hypothetical protein
MDIITLNQINALENLYKEAVILEKEENINKIDLFLKDNFYDGMKEFIFKITEISENKFEEVKKECKSEFPIRFRKEKGNDKFNDSDKFNNIIKFLNDELKFDTSEAYDIVVSVDELDNIYKVHIWFAENPPDQFSDNLKIKAYYKIRTERIGNDIYESIISTCNGQEEKLFSVIEKIDFFIAKIKSEHHDESIKNQIGIKEIFINSFEEIIDRIKSKYPFFFNTKEEIKNQEINDKIIWNCPPNVFFAIFGFLIENKLMYIKSPFKHETRKISKLLYQYFNVQTDERSKKTYELDAFLQNLKKSFTSSRIQP